MGKELPKQLSLHIEYGQISHSNKCSTYLQNWCLNKMRSQDWKQLVGRIIHGDYLSLIGGRKNLQSAAHEISTSFRILCLCLGKILQNPESIDAWEQRLGWIKSLSKPQKTLTESMESRRSSSGTSSQDSKTLQLSEYVKKFIVQIGAKTPEISQEEFYSCRCSMTFPVEQKTTKQNVWQTLDSYLCMQEDLVKGQWSFTGPGSEKKWYSIKEDSPQGIWDKIAERMLLEFAESGCPIFRATSRVSRSQLKSKRHGKLSIHFAATQETIETVFRIIVSANQLSLYGAVAEMCEEYESLHERTGRPVVMGQSIVLSAIKTEVSLESDDPAYQKNFYSNKYEERIEKLSQQDKLSKICMDAGFLSVVENGQYFMTKDTGDLTQFNTVACRECTLPREEATSQPKGWIQGNTKIGPVLEVTTCYLHGKHGVEIRIMSLSRDDTHSWVRISHGSNKFVMNVNNNDTEIPEDQLEEYALQLNAKDFACRAKAKAKPQRIEPAGSSSSIVPIGRRNWTDIEPGKYSLSEHEVSKKIIHLLRHSQKVHREEDGAVHFCRIKENSSESIPTIYSLV